VESCLPLHSRKCERQAPLDVLLAYHHRLTSCVAALPYSIALDWIQRKDEEERKVWADKHRSGTFSLGKIVKHLLEARALMWDLSMVPPPPRAPNPRTVADRPQRPPKQASDTADKPKFALQLKDGTKVCKNWNLGSSGDATSPLTQLALRQGRFLAPASANSGWRSRSLHRPVSPKFRKSCWAQNRFGAGEAHPLFDSLDAPDRRCSEPCPRGFKHVCNAVLKSGRVCGLSNHTSAECFKNQGGRTTPKGSAQAPPGPPGGGH
jgi:hypothetical protein